MHGRSGFLTTKNVVLCMMAMCLIVGLHYHSKLRTYSVNQDVQLLQLKEKEENLNENMKAVVETRSECLRNLRAVKNDLLSLKKSAQEKDDSAKQSYDSLRKSNEELSKQVSSLDVKYNNLLADYSKTQSASAKSLKETQEKLQQREEEIKLLKSEKESDLSKLKDEIANLRRENEELKANMKKHGVPSEVKPVAQEVKKQDVQVAPPNPKQVPYPGSKDQVQKGVEEPIGGLGADKANVIPPPEKREAADKAPQKPPGQDQLQVPLPAQGAAAHDMHPKEDQLQVPAAHKVDDVNKVISNLSGGNLPAVVPAKIAEKFSDRKASDDI